MNIEEREIRAELDRIVSSPGFSDAGRLSGFLRFVVERTIAADTGSLKESVLGVEVFGRPAGYDPRTDPIVRVEARRLRSRLAEYYDGPGSGATVVIELPKGGYVPVFRSGTPRPSALPPRRSWGNLLYLGITATSVLLALALYSWYPRPQPAGTLAVLPFANLSGDPGSDYFSDGLTEEIIDALARIPRLKVASRGAVFQFKGRHTDVRSVAAQLGATTVLEGSVRRSGSRVRINAQLVNADDGYNLWSESYDRELADIFAVQEDIARAIANALKLRLDVDRRQPLARRYTQNAEAYNLYLQGRYQWNLYSDDGMRRAAEYFRRATEIDPGYAPAYAMLASTYALTGYYELEPPRRIWREARIAAERAIALDPGLAEAQAALGFVLGLNEWKWADSERLLRRAVEQNPLSGDVRTAYAIACLLPQGRLEQANEQFRTALELDPLSVFANFGAAFGLLAAGRIEEAVTQYERLLKLNTTTPDMWWDYAMALAYAGRIEAAKRAFARQAEVAGRLPWRPGAIETALLGDPRKGRELIDEWLRQHPDGADSPMDMARTFATIGDRERAFAWLEKAAAKPDPQIVWIKVDPRLRSLHGDPRLKQIAARIGL